MLGETYERSYNHNYMIFPAKKKEYTGFCERMVQENEISVLLPCQFRVMEGSLYFYYEISGKRAMSQIFQKRKIGEKEMRQIFMALKKLQQEAERYLLDFTKLILLPEYLYADFDINHLYLVYDPDYEGDGSLNTIGNYLIEHVDYQETKAVELAYSFQQRITEENVNLQIVVDDLLKEKESLELEPDNLKEDSVAKVECSANSVESERLIKKRSPVLPRSSDKEKKFAGMEKWSLGELAWIQEIRDFFQGFSLFKKKSVADRKGKKKIRQRIEKSVYETEVSYEAEVEAPLFYSVSEGSEETQLFFSGEEKEIHCLIYQGRGAAQDLQLEVFPYIIGKSERGIDGRLYEPTISRIHSQLDFLNDTYYITDLNSTNGTFLNGERLCPNVRTELSFGDQVQFAGEKYIFQ